MIRFTPVSTTKFVLSVSTIMHLGHAYEQGDKSDESGGAGGGKAALYCFKIGWILEFAELLFVHRAKNGVLVRVSA